MKAGEETMVSFALTHSEALAGNGHVEHAAAYGAEPHDRGRHRRPCGDGALGSFLDAHAGTVHASDECPKALESFTLAMTRNGAESDQAATTAANIRNSLKKNWWTAGGSNP